MSRKFLFYLSLYVLILLFVFRNIIFNISTNLLDWRDYPFYIWQMYQNVFHISNLDFINFFETNAFYPHRLTLLFLDTMLPQSLIFLPFFSLTKNLILSLNLTFIITFVLNFVSVYLFWKQIFKKELLAFFGSLFFIFSPFFHSEFPHFTILSYWPFFFGLYFFLKGEAARRIKYFITVGLFLTIQFLASVYLSVFMIFAILVFYLVLYIFNPTNSSFKRTILGVLIIFSVFLATSGIFIKGYIDMKHTYNAKRDIREFIAYSAHLSDYFFTTEINSVIHQSTLLKLWNKLDKNLYSPSAFPGFLIFTLSLLALFKISRNKQLAELKLELNKERAYYLILTIIGFIFSLGPKLNFNGYYTYINLPYNFIMKFIPMLEAIRAPIRWSFLFYFGLIYFSLSFLSKFDNKQYAKARYKFIFVLIFIIFIFEYLPFNLESSRESYLTNDHQILKKICTKERKVLLELPVTHLNAAPNIREGLKYITTTVQLSSVYHGCFLINGYSGYDLPDNFVLADTLNNYIINGDVSGFISELRKRDINFVKFNSKYFSKELQKPLNSFLKGIIYEKGVEKIGQDIYKII